MRNIIALEVYHGPVGPCSGGNDRAYGPFLLGPWGYYFLTKKAAPSFVWEIIIPLVRARRPFLLLLCRGPEASYL